MESKTKILDLLQDTIKATRFGEDIHELMPEWLGGSLVNVRVVHKNGYYYNVNVDCDSGIAMVADVVKAIYDHV